MLWKNLQSWGHGDKEKICHWPYDFICHWRVIRNQVFIVDKAIKHDIVLLRWRVMLNACAEFVAGLSICCIISDTECSAFVNVMLNMN